MKLRRFKEQDNKRIGIIVFTIVCILLVSGVIFYRTFAIFEVKTSQNVIKGTVQDPGNLYFAFYVNDGKEDKIQKEMPTKDYVLDEDKSYCGINGNEDPNIKVSLTDDYTVHVSGMTSSRTKCNLYFVKGVFILGKPIKAVRSGNGLYEVTHEDVSGTLDDEEFKKTEWRYAGVNYTEGNEDYVHNYVSIDGQVWRIIGLVNTQAGQRVKLIKEESIGKFSWDSSKTAINNGYGVNEWSQSDLMKLLNDGYEKNELEYANGVKKSEEYVNNSLYWNGGQGRCYVAASNDPNDCNFIDDKKMPDILKSMIENISWSTGSDNDDYSAGGNALNFYKYERSSTKGKLCDSSNSWCNDTEKRQNSWEGKVGLIYPSDYGYATSGGILGRERCFSQNLNVWSSEDYGVQCVNNDWLKPSSNYYWTLTPHAYKNDATRAFVINGENGGLFENGVNMNYHVRPTVYLSPSVKITSGTGTSDNAFQLELK